MTTEPDMIIRKVDGDWIGWVEGMPGVNSQGQTRDELIENLRSAIAEWREMQQDGPACSLNPEP